MHEWQFRSITPAITTAVDKGIGSSCCIIGNRNFCPHALHPSKLNEFLMSPMLVVAYALTGRVGCWFNTRPYWLRSKRTNRWYEHFGHLAEGNTALTANRCINWDDFHSTMSIHFRSSPFVSLYLSFSEYSRQDFVSSFQLRSSFPSSKNSLLR